MADSEKLGIASVPIRGDLKELDKDLDKANKTIETKLLKGIQDVGGKIASVGSKVIVGGIAAGTAALVGMTAAVGGLAMDAAKLEPAKNTFNNLAESIGATSDALMGDLREATRGMVADSELVAAGNQLMAMGLAGNAEEAAALTEMAVQLGAAMGGEATESINNFALMLANQALPRLDSFGISSGRVRQRMAELIETGQAADSEEAFKLATLEIGAETMARVGDQSQTLAGDMARMKAQFANTKQAIGEAFIPVAAQLADVALPLIQTALEKLLPFAQDAATWLGEHLPVAIAKVQEIIPALSEGIGKVVEGLGALTSGDVPGFLANLQEGLYTLGDAFGISKDKIDPVIEGFRTIASTIETRVLPIVNDVVGFVRDNLTPILAGLAGALLAIVVPAFVGWATAAGAAAAATITALAPVLIPIVAIGAAVGLLTKAWESDWGGIRTTLTVFWEDTGSPIFETVKDWLQTQLPEAIAKMAAWFSEKWDAITGKFDAAKELIVGAAGTVKTWFGETLPTAAEDMRAKITDKANTVADAFKEKFTSTMDELNPTWREDWEEIKATASEKMEDAKVALGLKLDETKTKVGAFLTDTKKEWTDKWEEIRSNLAQFGAKLIAAAGEAMGPFLNFIKEQVDLLKGKFTEIDWKSVGEGIINGIKEGVKNLAGKLGEEAANAASAALNWAKQKLGIGSPSRVAAAEIGVPFIEGIIAGLNTATPDLTGAISNIMQDMAGVASSLTGMGGYQQQAGIGGVVDAIIADARIAGKKLVEWFKLWKESTIANVEMGGEASGLLGGMFGPVKQWVDGLTAMAGYQKAANMAQSAQDMVEDARAAGKQMMAFFKLWTETTFANVEMGGKAAKAMSDLFAPVKTIIDGVTAIAGYQKALNIVQNVEDMIADARLAGKRLVDYFKLWTENTFANVEQATKAGTAMAGLFAPAKTIVDGLGAIAGYQKAGNLVKKVERMIADARAAGKLLVDYFKLWHEGTFANVAQATSAAEAMSALFGSIKKISDNLTGIMELKEIQPETIDAAVRTLTHFANRFMKGVSLLLAALQHIGQQIAPEITASAKLYAQESAAMFAYFREGSDYLDDLMAAATPDEDRVNQFVAAIQRVANQLRNASNLSAQASGYLATVSANLGMPGLSLKTIGGALNTIATLPAIGVDTEGGRSSTVTNSWTVNAYYTEIETETTVRDTIRSLQMAGA